ncbi:1-phosphofructokinase family hexose kinase [Flavobacterium gawalongense]|uniref:1-phosphofructokinase family hexose kinase n=1 Tax=Flavobacterium gawalongense TaxID=2594432 RepID=A0A553BTR9_9FLAO|nr:1-phosphofructokinase family hexose kinase [Flavobacterium gawalongense]TRX11651.1 1-phosphofructokinase family hexose kinase [Flavobacterium gawalongense]TRX12346.1 1-phosphofructokinase family hexose kinase [Flavobacterium gawalongense]TRX30389.1 1-phosphofructokinase family hexose kinase [Flavobacterium gawalongense]
MKSFDIVTLTVNPALDKSAHFRGLVPEQKIRCGLPRYDAGGGGINVSKAISRLGGQSYCVFTSGGPIGTMLKELVQKEKIEYEAIEIQSWTRESFVAVDDNTNLQYRFSFQGAEITTLEKDKIIQTIQKLKSKYLVISGGLNEGLSSDFYQVFATIAKESNSKLIVDTSGEALKKVIEAGVYMIKPNIGELAKLIDVESLEMEEVNKAAKQIIAKGGAEIVVVSLGPQGAVLVTKDSYDFVPAPNVVKKSTVGAGDSMVGGMVWALSQNKNLKEVIRWGVACGSAATMNEGTQLFRFEDAKRLFEWLKNK